MTNAPRTSAAPGRARRGDPARDPATPKSPGVAPLPTDTETRLRLAIASTRAGTHVRDLLTDEADWSPRLREIYGMTPDEPATSATWLARVHPDDRTRALAAMAAALDPSGDGHYRATFRVVHPDGTVRWVEGHGQVAFEPADGGLRPVRLAGLAFDVTERVATLEALRESESRLDLAMRSANLGVFDHDLATDALSWSAATLRIFGMDAEAVPSVADAMRRVHPDDRALVEAAQAAAFDPAGDGAFRVRMRILRAAGDVRWIEAVGQARFDGPPDAPHRATRLCGVVADVTDAQVAMDRCARPTAARTSFLAMLAHELRNPLAPLVTAHAILERGGGLGERERAALEIARRQTRQLARLVDDLLEVSRITRGLISLRLAPVGIAAAVYEAAETLAPSIESRRQALEVRVPPRTAADRRGRREARAGAREPARQRLEVHARGRHDPRRGRGPERRGGDPRDRQRRRHRPRAAVVDLRAVRPGRRVARPRAGRPGHRARAGAPAGRDARRARLGGERGPRSRCDLHRAAAGARTVARPDAPGR